MSAVLVLLEITVPTLVRLALDFKKLLIIFFLQLRLSFRNDIPLNDKDFV